MGRKNLIYVLKNGVKNVWILNLESLLITIGALYYVRKEIDKLMNERGMRKIKKALRTLVPIGLEAGIAMLGLEEIMSPMQTIIANAAVGLGAQLFCTEKELQLAEDKAYLFYARQNEMIMPYKRRY